MKLSTLNVRWFRLCRSGLVKQFSSVTEAASKLVGIQAQILPAAALALWNRSTYLTETEFDNQLYDKKTLVKLWGQRHTLHLYPSEEWPLIYAALRDKKSWWERQVEQQGGDLLHYKSVLKHIAEYMRQQEAIGRDDLKTLDLDLHESYYSAWGGIFADLVRNGLVCHARRVGNQGQFAHREVWLPDLDWNPPPTEEANIRLARRYLKAYGPATVKDLAYWRGAKISEARRWVAALQSEICTVKLNEQSLLALKIDLDDLTNPVPHVDEWPIHLLYRFDPLLLGLKDKTWLIDGAYYNRVWRPAGHIEGTVLVGGQIVGTWRYDRKQGGLIITVSPFSSLSAKTKGEIEKRAVGVAKFFNKPLVDLIITV